MSDPACASYATFLSFAGISSSAVLACAGAVYATIRSGMTISMVGVHKSELIIKSLLPVIMAGMLGIFGLITSIWISLALKADRPLTSLAGSFHLGAGLCCGLASLGAGYAIGVIGEHGIRAYAKEQRVFFVMVLVLVFSEIIGLFGLIIAGTLITQASSTLYC